MIGRLFITMGIVAAFMLATLLIAAAYRGGYVDGCSKVVSGMLEAVHAPTDKAALKSYCEDRYYK